MSETVWVATLRDPVWVGRGDDDEYLFPGQSAVLAPGARRWVSTSAATCAAPVLTDPLGSATGVFHGTVSFGPLAPETLELPGFLSTAGQPQLDDDLILALQHVESFARRRWSGAQLDGMAQVIVATTLQAWTPPVLRDNSLGRVIDALVDDTTERVRVADLAALIEVSERAVRRRFRETTGRSPEQFARWIRALRIRHALDSGPDESVVAACSGFASVGSMRRALRRAAA